MSTQDRAKKLEEVKNLLKKIHSGASVEELKDRFRELLSTVSPLEIPLIEQELVREGIPVSEILKMCDLHVELFRDSLASRELGDVPRGHPVYLLVKENDVLLKKSEVLRVVASVLLSSANLDEVGKYLEELSTVLRDLKKIKLHYRKIQMLIFPYLERRGITAVPRVMWGREDQVIVKLRELSELVDSTPRPPADATLARNIARRALEVSQEISDLVFRENKILYPATLALLSTGEWAAIAEEARRFPWLVQIESGEWSPSEKPVMPYEVTPTLTEDQVEKLPPEFKFMALSKGIVPDTYDIRESGDLELGTGFLSAEEVSGVFRSLPIEVTYANKDDRVKFYSESELSGGFARARTIVGRKVEFCHPPRLELTVRKVVDAVKSGKAPYREFWTKSGDRVMRVIIAPVKNARGEIIGTVEVVEDLTDVITNVEEIKKKIVVL